MATNPRLRPLLVALLASFFVLAAVASAAAADAVTPQSAVAATPGPLQRSVHHKRHKRHKRHRARASRVTQLALSTSSPASGQTLSGSVNWHVSVSGATPTRVDFAVDGTVKWSQNASPYVYGGSGGSLDTTQIPDGSHT